MDTKCCIVLIKKHICAQAFSPGDLARLVRGLAMLRWRPSPLWLGAMASAAASVAGRFSPAELAMLLSACGLLR